MKKSQISTIALIMIAMLTFQLAACTAKPPDSAIQTAVVETLAAAPTQPAAEVTKLVEVTQIVEVTAPASVDSSTSTPAATDTPADTATATQGDTATPDETQLAVTPDTATPTALQPGSPLGWSLQYFVSRYNIMTDLQRQQFALALPGKTISWYASLSNVNPDGSVVMKFPFGMQGSIILTGVPAETAVKINKGDQVEFSGMIDSFDIVFNTLVISNVKIIAFYVEPTPTITPTPLPPTPTVYVSPN